jgi:hypothetical protein
MLIRMQGNVRTWSMAGHDRAEKYWFVHAEMIRHWHILTYDFINCYSAANVVCRDFDVFRNHNVSLEHILL